MAERITVRVRASSAHVDVLTVQDAMRQVLDIFLLLGTDKDAVKWNLVHATTNSPFQLQGEAVSLEPAVDVSVIARSQKLAVVNGLREIAQGRYPEAWADSAARVAVAKRILTRNLNGIGDTMIDFDAGEPVVLTPAVAEVGLRALDKKPESNLYDLPNPRQEVGSIEGTFLELATHWNHPAVRIMDSRTREPVWCRLSAELQAKFEDKARFSDIWGHKRVIVRGRLRYDEERTLAYVLATDIEKIEPTNVSVHEIRDKEFTGGMSIVEYLDRFRDGALG